jgi:stearoyl-CoA desaturase (Delta-9 desaturase)
VRRWNPLNTPFLLGTALLAMVLVPIHVVHAHSLGIELVVTGAMFVAIGLGVTAGYHRLFSHRTYQASGFVRFLLLCFGAASFQNSALQWSSDHRLHHRFVDTEQDPYNIRKGFWYAHWIWVMESSSHHVQGVADLEKDPLIRWQNRYYFIIGAVVASIPLGIGLITHDLWGHFVMGVLLRIVLTHHTTFLINSAAHWFGTRPYTDENTARDNPLLGPLTFGEGYHNFHHMWPGDYRNGVRWYHFDSTKWLLWSLALTGLIRDLKRVPRLVIKNAKQAMKEKRLRSRFGIVQGNVH